MALWTNDEGEQFDDGLAFEPGEEGFTRDLAAKHYGKGVAFNYMGTPNWSLRIAAEQKAEAEAAKAERDAAELAAREAAAEESVAQGLAAAS